jgi:hypothetical protein
LSGGQLAARISDDAGMSSILHRTRDQLDAGLTHIRQSPPDEGVLEMIVRRPGVGTREVLDVGEIDLADGLSGDTWNVRPSSRMRVNAPHPDMQVTLINARAIALIALDRDRWPLAGDQLYVDFDLSAERLPPGTRLQIGSAVLEVTNQPHTGCGKFAASFGVDATKFVNSPVGRQLNLRGINARVVRPGTVRVGDSVRRAAAD